MRILDNLQIEIKLIYWSGEEKKITLAHTGNKF